MHIFTFVIGFITDSQVYSLNTNQYILNVVLLSNFFENVNLGRLNRLRDVLENKWIYCEWQQQGKSWPFQNGGHVDVCEDRECGWGRSEPRP